MVKDNLLLILLILIALDFSVGIHHIPLRNWKRDILSRRAVNTNVTGGIYSDTGAYTATIAIGTPPRMYNVLIDSGSANLYIPNVDCVQGESGSAACQYANAPYDPSKSSSFKSVACNSNGPRQSTFSPECGLCTTTGECVISNTYGSGGNYSAYVYSDLLAFPDTNLNAVEVYFGAYFEEYGFVVGAQLDGILGMAYRGLSHGNLPIVIQDVIDGNSLQNAFAMCFTTTSGVMTIGGVDSSLHQGAIQYTNVTDTSAHYEIAIDDIVVNNQSIAFDFSTVEPLVDTGTTLVVFPDDAFAALKSLMQSNCPRSGNPQYLCSGQPSSTTIFDAQESNQCISMSQSNVDSFPNITFKLPNRNGGAPITIHLQPYQYLIPVSYRGNTGCYIFGISNQEFFGQEYIIFGDTFLLDQYVVFDRQNQRIGFAQASPSCGSFEPSAITQGALSTNVHHTDTTDSWSSSAASSSSSSSSSSASSQTTRSFASTATTSEGSSGSFLTTLITSPAATVSVHWLTLLLIIMVLLLQL